jgi:tellurite resistance protein TehA-like permease
MGTGIVPILISALPYSMTDESVLHYIALCFLVLNIVLFTLFLLASIARYIMFPKVWGLMIHHPVQSLFIVRH